MNLSIHRQTGFVAAAVALAASQFVATQAMAQIASPPVFGGSGTQNITDVIVRSDGSQYVVGSFTGELQIGACPSANPPCKFSATSGKDAFVARIDVNSDPVWVRTLGGAGAQDVIAILQDQDRIYLVGTSNDIVDLGVGSIGGQGTNSLFVLALQDQGTTAVPQWRASATSDELAVTHAELVGANSAELLVLGGAYQCQLTAGTSLTLNADSCVGSKMYLAALELPAVFSGSMDRLNDNWRWVESSGDEKVTAMTATPSGVLFATATTGVLELQDLTHYEQRRIGGNYISNQDSTFQKWPFFLRADYSIPGLPDDGLYQSVVVADSLPGTDPALPVDLLPIAPRSRPQAALVRAFFGGYNGGDAFGGPLGSLAADAMTLVQEIDLAAVTEPVLEFYHHIGGQTMTSNNVLKVMVRTDGEADLRDIVVAGGVFRQTAGLRYYEGVSSGPLAEPTFIGNSGSVYERSLIELDGLVNSDGSPAQRVQLSWIVRTDASFNFTNYWQIDDVRVIDEATQSVVLEEDFDFTGAPELEYFDPSNLQGNVFGLNTQPWQFRNAMTANATHRDGFLFSTDNDKEDRRLGPTTPLDLSATTTPVMEICHRISSQAVDVLPFPYATINATEVVQGGGVLEVSVDNGPWERVPNSRISGKKYSYAVPFNNALQTNTDEDSDPATTLVWGGPIEDHITNQDCETSTINLSAYKSNHFRFRLRYATRFDNRPSPINGSEIDVNGWLVSSIVIRDGASELISTRAATEPPQRLIRITDTFEQTPRITYRETLLPELRPRALAAIDDTAVIVAGTLSSTTGTASISTSDFGVAPATPMDLGAFVGRLDVSNPLSSSWAWVRSDSGSEPVTNCPTCPIYSSYLDAVVTQNSIFLVGEFLGYWGVDVDPGFPTVDDGVVQTNLVDNLGGMILKLDPSTGQLDRTNDNAPWLFGGAAAGNPRNSFLLGSGSPNSIVNPTDIHTDGLGRLVVAGQMRGSNLNIGQSLLQTPGDTDAFSALVSVGGGAVITEDWTVGQPLRNGFPILSAAQRPRAFRNGVEFDAYAAGLLYYDQSLTLAYPTEEQVPSGHIIPLSATADPIELVWTDDPTDPLNSARIARTNTIEWPSQFCSTTITDACIQLHTAGAPVELNSDTHAFRQLFNAPEGGSNAAVDPATALFAATTPGYSVVRYEGLLSDLVFEVVLTRGVSDALTAGPPRIVSIGSEIRPPLGYPQQPGRPGYLLNELAYVDGLGPNAAYDRARRQGQIFPVNRENPAAGAQALQIAWYQSNGRGVYWPDRVDAYNPQWPDEARGLIISAIAFSAPDSMAPLGCSGPATIQLHNTRQFENTNPGQIDLRSYSLEYPQGPPVVLAITTNNESSPPPLPGGASMTVTTTAPLCRDEFVTLRNGARVVDQFAVTPQSYTGLVSANDGMIRRNSDVCIGNADRYNAFSVAQEWAPITGGLGAHASSCTEKIIIASQGGSEISGRDFPSDLIISQYLEDGPSADGKTNQNQLIEIYNGTSGPLEISNYRLRLLRFDAGPTPSEIIISLPFNRTLMVDETWVVGHPENEFRDNGLINQTDPQMLLDGNDAVLLEKLPDPFDTTSLPAVIDSFGADANPGNAWVSQNVTSQLVSLTRNDRICVGDSDTSDTFQPHEQWQVQPLVDLAGVGSHATDCIRTQLPLLDPNRFIDWSIYAQADPLAIGFNPNDEHALKAASRTDSGFQAAFALRSDFGSALGVDDMNMPVDMDNASEPYVLVRYQEPVDRQLAGFGAVGFRVFKVEPINEESRYDRFMFESTAGFPIFAPYPLSSTGNCSETRVDGESLTGDRIPPAPFFRDYTNQLWARSANRSGRDAIVRYWYPLADNFYFEDSRSGADIGDCIPWMPNLPISLGGSGDDRPVATRFDIKWPDRPLQLSIGESLIDAKRGLPSIRQQSSVQVVFDEVQETALENPGTRFDPRSGLVEYFDPLQTRSIDVDETAIPSGIARIVDPSSGFETLVANNLGYKLPFVLRSRLAYDTANDKLMFRGLYREGGNDPLLLTNILSDCEAQHLKDFPAIDPAIGFDCGTPLNPANTAWNAAIDELTALSRNPGGIENICEQVIRNNATGALSCRSAADLRAVTSDDILVGYADDFPSGQPDGVLERFSQASVPGVLSAGAAQSSGFVTIALNNDPLLSPQPVSLRVIQVGCIDIDGYLSPYQGQVHVVESDGVFDESLALRHSGDFAGRLDQVEFQWCIVEDSESRSPRPPASEGLLCSEKAPQCLTPDPDDPQSCLEWGLFAGIGAGTPEITIAGASSRTLSDNWVVARYRFVDDQGAQTGLCQANTDQYSIFAGAPGAPPREPMAQLAQGWIKRVVDRLNPFDTRVRDFHAAAVNTVSSLIAQLGERFEGDIPLVSTPDNLNSLGIIEAYETVLNRALAFIYGDGGSNSPPPTAASNNAILLISTRLADLYTALGNEAYTDALDPLVGLTRPVLGTIATETFNFKNQLASLLEEELVLLRGRDNTQGGVVARPVYNRLFPNFTGAEGQAAYALAYNITDQTGPDGVLDSIIDERDALALFPQGHGDAWGHFLQAMSYHYDLMRNMSFTWKARTENVLLNGGPLPVDYLDERKFAANAAVKARVGAEIVDLTYRDFYTEDPNGQWQGYKDNRLDRQWGVSGWASRAGQGAYYDWLTANTIIPPEHRPLAFSAQFTAPFCNANPGDAFCVCLADPDNDCDTPSTGFRDHYCALPENTANAYCDCIDDNGTQVCPLDFPARGIQVIERGNVGELDEILDQYLSVQTQVDEVNRGLNPLGISRDAVPFDIDPSRVDQNETHFEQVAERASTALENAAQVWDFANRINEMLRYNQDDVDDLRQNREEAEFDFNNRLLDIFGTPYPNRIGAGRTYPDAYDGPDFLHYFEIGLPALSGTEFGAVNIASDGSLSDAPLAPGNTLETLRTFYANEKADTFVNFTINRTLENECPALSATPGDANECSAILDAAGATGTPIVAELTQLTSPEIGLVYVNAGAGQRRITGALQQAYQDAINARIEFSQALADYNAHIFDVIAFKDQFAETFRTRSEQIRIQTNTRDATRSLGAFIGVAQAAAAGLRASGFLIEGSFATAAKCLPTVVGLANDVTSAIRCSVDGFGDVAKAGFEGLAEVSDGIGNALALAKDDVALENDIAQFGVEAQLELIGISGDLSSAIEHEPVLRLEVTRRAQNIQSAQSRIANLLSDGQTILVERANYRRKTASAVSEYRFQDIAFRQYRNEVIQKYRATFDLAARFVYLAAKAYDYETNLLGSDSRAGQSFLTDIVRHRSIGQLLDGVPVAGSNGLTDSLGRMQANFEVLKGQMGFNNPQIETNRFSLRRELFRLEDSASDPDGVLPPTNDDRRWTRRLASSRVLDLNNIPEFRKMARPFDEVGTCPQPGLVIEFYSDVKSGNNFFGLELEARDSSYDSSQFATKIRGVGAWFKDYDGNVLGLSETPRVYLLPVGDDVLRPANGLSFDTRLWKVVDQVIPVPFPIGDNDIAMPEFSPGSDSLSDAFALDRRIGRFRAYPFRELGFDQEFSTDSRLIGRSVWNSRWMLIIPGATLLGDADEGLDRFIYGEDVPGDFWEDDAVRNRYTACTTLSGNKQAAPTDFVGGVSDILLFFRTYAYSGN